MAPRNNKADDLKRIKGIGKQNEGRLHGLGVWHFDQIAAWTLENVKWVGSYLAFRGRIDREQWIAQAKELASGHETEFSWRAAEGKVATSKDDDTHGQTNLDRSDLKRGSSMSAREVLFSYTEALDRADLATIAALIHEDFHLEGAGLDGIGKREFLAAMKAQLDAFTGYSENPSDIVEDGSIVHFVAHVTGRHTGTLVLPGMAAIAPTGRSIALPPEPAWVQVTSDKLLVYHVTKVPGGGIDGILSQIGADH